MASNCCCHFGAGPRLTESEKQTISALSTLAGGLAGGLAAGGLNNAIAAAGTAKNAVENNHLNPIEDASLEIMRKEYNSSCVGVSSDECTKLKADIEALFKKAQSILKDETISLASDATWDSKLDHKPGDIVMCKTSYTSFCVVTDQFVKTADGNEWYLKPATVEQALEGRANQEKMASDLNASLKQFADDSFSEGCGGMGLIGIGCQLSMAFGVTNPVTEAKATTGERIGWFAQALLNIVGLKAAVGGAAAEGAKGTPAWDNAISKADGDFGYLPPVRQNYVKDVYDLQGAVDKMRASGASAEDVAKYAYGARNELKMKYREYTPPEMLDVIDARNLERYGNKIGPAFDDLVKKGKTFDQIIESSTRAGGGDLFQ